MTKKSRIQNGCTYRTNDSRNTSGVVGITLHLKAAPEPYQGVYVGWTAVYMVDGVQRRRTWSVGQWGYEEAWKKALAYRAKMAGTPRARKAPPDKAAMAKLLKNRLGADWRELLRPAFKTWWA